MSSPENAKDYEETHVHSVYEQIAFHFSSTRYKPWPIISNYLVSLPPYSLGLDVGCGNGKNMPVNPQLFILGSDRSESLIRIAAEKGEVVVADILGQPVRSGMWDFVICIAVLHHLSSHDRRVEGIREMLELLKPANEDTTQKSRFGTMLIYVWALEQKSSRRGWEEGGEQDVMVPWILKKKGEEEKVFQRYYHLYKKGELEESIVQAGGVVMESGYEKDNWWAIARRKS